MRFSIIIPAHNSELYITKALESIKKQTFKDYQLIVVCDSCTDNTKAIAQMYGAITCSIDAGNDGVARSIGLDLAKGEYVLFMDDDDWWLHEYVLEQIDEFLTQRHPDILAFSFIFKGVGYARPTGNCGKLWISVWSKCWKRECIGNTRFPNIESISDQYFHNEMMQKNLFVLAWDMPMYYYNYLRPGSISQKEGQTAEEMRRCLNI